MRLNALKYAVCGLVLASGLPACQNAQDIKRQQYFVEGMELYKVHCANCHQSDGSGLKNLYPPLEGSDFLAKNKDLVVCMMRYGHNEPLVVNGRRYTQPMPANRQLQPLDLAEITTYVYNKWGAKKGITETDYARQVLNTCAAADH